MNAKTKVAYLVLVGIGMLFIAIFGAVWFQLDNIPNNFSGVWHGLDLLLFATLTYVMWHSTVMRLFTWSVAYNMKHQRSVPPKDGLEVAFITTFVPGSESIQLLHRTLPAMVAADYPHDTWLLDEGNDPEVKQICWEYGVRHFSRKGRNGYNTKDGKYAAKTKGGNHNSWYEHFGHYYDFVAQMDTDFIPRRDYLTKTLGYFRDESVAFVGTPQIYGNTEESFIAKAAAEQTYNFYGPLLRGFSGMKMNMLIGANHVIRVKALESVDHYSAHITEDLLTGMKLHAGNWTSVYTHEPLAIGEGPSTWQAYFSQQMRWAYGCMDILFHHSRQLMQTMGLRQALYYFILQQHYFTGLIMALSVVLLGLYFVFGLALSDIGTLEFLTFYIVMLASSGLVNLWLQRFNARPDLERGLMIAGRAASIAVWPVFFLALVGVLRGKRLSYKVTPKGHGTRAYSAPLHLFVPHIIVGIFCLELAALGPVTDNNSIVMEFWAICTAVLMLAIPFALPAVAIYRAAIRRCEKSVRLLATG